MSERYTHLDSIKVDGIATTSQQGALIGASKVMPQPSADLDGVTIQYMGPTDSNYTFKRMYTCTTVGSEYKWVDATPVDIVQNSNGLFIGGNEIEVADSTTYGVMSPDQAEKVESSFVKLETVTEGAEPNKVDIVRVEGTPLQVSGFDKSVNITRSSLGLGDSAQLDVGTLEGQIPVLGANGLLPESTLPSFSTGTFIDSVRTKALLTSLSTAKLGDWAKVTSDDDFNNNGLYILNGTSYEVLSNWVQMVGPASVESVNGKSGMVVLNKEDIGLANVDNTSDADKPISTATQAALNLKVDKVSGKGLSTNDYTDADKTKLAGIAPGAQVNVLEGVKVNGVALTPTDKIVDVTVPTDTADLTNGADFATMTEVTTAVSPKADASDLTAHTGNRSNPHGVTKSQIGLGNVDNTSDAKKPISEAMQSALDNCVKLSGSDTEQVIQNGGLQLPNGDLSIGGGALIGKDTQPALFRVRGNIEATLGISGPLIQTASLEASDNSTNVASTAWVATATSVVHTIGDETINGKKTFTTSPVIKTESNAGANTYATSMDWTQTFNSFSRAFQILSKDKNGVNVSQIETDAENNDERAFVMSLYGKTGVTTSMSLRDDGTNQYATAPPTKDEHPSNAIVTKGYLQSTIEQVSSSSSKEPYFVAFDPAVAVTNATTCIKYLGRCSSYTKPVMSNDALDRGSWTDDEPLLKRMQYCTFRANGTIKEVLYKNDLTKVWIKNYEDGTPDTPIFSNGDLMEYCTTQTQLTEIPADAPESSIKTLDTMLVIPTLYTYGNGCGFMVSYDPAGGTAEAHTLDGHTYKYEAIGVYLASNSSDSTMLMSVSDAEPLKNQNRYTFRSKLTTKDQTNGKWKLFNYYDSRMFKLLAYLIGGSLDSQNVFGAGLSTGSMGSWERNYATYTGKTNTVGMLGQSSAFTQKYDADKYGVADNGNTTSVRQVKFLIEAYWGQVWQFIDDHIYEADKGRVYAGMNSASVIHALDDSTGKYFTNQIANPTNVSLICTVTDTDGLPGLVSDPSGAYSSMLRTEDKAWGLPVNTTGSSTVGTCDGWWASTRTSSGARSVLVGGISYNGARCGVACWYGCDILSVANAYGGARACFLFD